MMLTRLKFCECSEDFVIAKAISNDYLKWLNIDLSFQNISREFEDFDKMYGMPYGVYIIAYINYQVVGGVGARMIGQDICEMKRLFVYEDFRGKGIAKTLCEALFLKTFSMSYKKMRLDTISSLENANRLYAKLGFIDIPRYCKNPLPNVRYMEKSLL